MARIFTVIIGIAIAFPHIVSAGVIDEAQPLSVGLTNILNFLLSIVGIVGIIGVVASAFLYLFAAGDMRQLGVAKRAFATSVVGILIALGGYAFIRTLTGLLID